MACFVGVNGAVVLAEVCGRVWARRFAGIGLGGGCVAYQRRKFSWAMPDRAVFDGFSLRRQEGVLTLQLEWTIWFCC